jgi:hypothetical protein
MVMGGWLCGLGRLWGWRVELVIEGVGLCSIKHKAEACGSCCLELLTML